jgi:hypothetical protein
MLPTGVRKLNEIRSLEDPAHRLISGATTLEFVLRTLDPGAVNAEGKSPTIRERVDQWADRFDDVNRVHFGLNRRNLLVHPLDAQWDLWLDEVEEAGGYIDAAISTLLPLLPSETRHRLNGAPRASEPIEETEVSTRSAAREAFTDFFRAAGFVLSAAITVTVLLFGSVWVLQHAPHSYKGLLFAPLLILFIAGILFASKGLERVWFGRDVNALEPRTRISNHRHSEIDDQPDPIFRLIDATILVEHVLKRINGGPVDRDDETDEPPTAHHLLGFLERNGIADETLHDAKRAIEIRNEIMHGSDSVVSETAIDWAADKLLSVAELLIDVHSFEDLR